MADLISVLARYFTNKKNKQVSIVLSKKYLLPNIPLKGVLPVGIPKEIFKSKEKKVKWQA